MTTKRYTCPHCGNADRSLIEDNGHKWTHPDCTLLCVAPVPAGECDSFDVTSDGTAVCGMQWDPYQVADEDETAPC